MVRTKRRSTALKMALAGMCTALCIEGMLQRGLYVPARAQDAAADLALTIEWLTSTPEELQLFAVGAFGSFEAAIQNPTFAAVWAGYKEAKWFIENPSLEAVSDINGSISIQNLNPTIGYYYPASGRLTPMLWYDLSLLDNLTAQKITGFPFAECQDFTAKLRVENRNSANPTVPYIRSITYNVSSNSINLQVFTQNTFNSSSNQDTLYIVDCDSYFNSFLFTGFIYTGYNGMRFDFNNVDSVPTLLNTSTPTTGVSGNIGYWTFNFSGDYHSIDMTSLPDIGVKQMFVPATATNWINNDFYPYVASQTEEGQPLEGFELTPPPGVTPDLPEVGTLNSLNFPPGLPSVQFNDVDLPSEPLPAKALQGAGFWFSSFSNMLDALGVKYIVITFLIIALIMAILKI